MQATNFSLNSDLFLDLPDLELDPMSDLFPEVVETPCNLQQDHHYENSSSNENSVVSSPHNTSFEIDSQKQQYSQNPFSIPIKQEPQEEHHSDPQIFSQSEFLKRENSNSKQNFHSPYSTSFENELSEVDQIFHGNFSSSAEENSDASVSSTNRTKRRKQNHLENNDNGNNTTNEEFQPGTTNKRKRTTSSSVSSTLPKIKSESVRQQLLQILPSSELSQLSPKELAKISNNNALLKTKRRRYDTKPENDEERRRRRLEANRLAAQASRDRKKLRRFFLERQLQELQTVNKQCNQQIEQLTKETESLKQEFVQLQNLVNSSLTLSKMQARQELERLSALTQEKQQQQQQQQQQQAQAAAWLMLVLHSFGDLFKNSTTLDSEKQNFRPTLSCT